MVSQLPGLPFVVNVFRNLNLCKKYLQLAEMESSETSLATRTHFEVLDLSLKAQVLGLGLEAYKSSKMFCSRFEDSIIFWLVTIKMENNQTKDSIKLYSFQPVSFFIWKII